MLKLKTGYTLAEVLIAVAVVAIVSVAVLPLVNKLKPDPIKVLYCLTYNNLLNTVTEMADNIEIYPVTDNAGNVNEIFKKFPFQNESEYTLPNNTKANGSTKFCTVLSNYFAKSSDCRDVNTYADNNFQSMFTNNKGSEFMVVRPNLASWRRDIYVDINGHEEGPNCLYSAQNPQACRRPDRFKISVLSDGTMAAQDPIGVAYLDTRTDWMRRDIIAGVPIDLHDVPINNNGGGNEPRPGRQRTSRIDCTKSYISEHQNSGYGIYDANGKMVPTQACYGGFVNVEMEEDRRGTMKEAYDKCIELGGRLPTTQELSALGRYEDLLNLSHANYWGIGSTKDLDNPDHIAGYCSAGYGGCGGARNCYLPTGNCGLHSPSDVQRYRCVYDD